MGRDEVKEMRAGVPLCYLCKRYQGSKSHPREDGKGWVEYCEAYPDGDGIPRSIDYWTGHFTPQPGDHGLQFLPKDGLDPKMIEYHRKAYAKNLQETNGEIPDFDDAIYDGRHDL